MKEIHQTDLMLYPDLEYLFIGGNDIEVIEEDLFKYNLKLKAFSCWNCKIFHVDPKVFDNLSQLTDIWLVLNQCIDKRNEGSVRVGNMIGMIKDKCVSPAFLILKMRFDDFEETHRNLPYEKFNEKLELLELELKSSKFCNFPSFKNKIEELKIQNMQNSCKTDNHAADSSNADGITALNMKINDIESDLKNSIIDTSKDLENYVKNLNTSKDEELRDLKDKIDDLKSANEAMSRKIDRITNKFDKLTEILEKIDEKVSKCAITQV
ncbi:TNF receptor-associated factor family protein DDB_G0279745-like [Chironomus tepperi]|uniref:TNF receptor-associated factor family protein DDB_G0279745-like n=1 Tax=Chironomus tepperi TaxID=113505 RepID=UPI00391F0363